MVEEKILQAIQPYLEYPFLEGEGEDDTAYGQGVTSSNQHAIWAMHPGRKDIKINRESLERAVGKYMGKDVSLWDMRSVLNEGNKRLFIFTNKTQISPDTSQKILKTSRKLNAFLEREERIFSLKKAMALAMVVLCVVGILMYGNVIDAERTMAYARGYLVEIGLLSPSQQEVEKTKELKIQDLIGKMSIVSEKEKLLEMEKEFHSLIKEIQLSQKEKWMLYHKKIWEEMAKKEVSKMLVTRDDSTLQALDMNLKMMTSKVDREVGFYLEVIKELVIRGSGDLKSYRNFIKDEKNYLEILKFTKENFSSKEMDVLLTVYYLQQETKTLPEEIQEDLEKISKSSIHPVAAFLLAQEHQNQYLVSGDPDSKWKAIQYLEGCIILDEHFQKAIKLRDFLTENNRPKKETRQPSKYFRSEKNFY